MSWLPLNLASPTFEQDIPAPTVGGITYPGSRLLVSGEPESLKSWLAAVLAVERVLEEEHVVWCDFEQGPAMTRARFVDLGLTPEQLGLVLYFEPREPVTEGVRNDLVEHLARFQPTLTVIDAYAGLLGVHDYDPDSSRDIEKINRQVVDVFRDHGSTVVILDHVVKSRDNRSRYSAGSGRKLAEVEVHLGMERGKHFTRGGEGTARIRNHKDRLGALAHPYLGELHLASDPETGAVTWAIRQVGDTAAEQDHFRPTALMERVSQFLEAQLEPVSRNHVETNVRGKSDYIRLAIDVLLTERFVSSHPGPRNAIHLQIVRPYRQANDHAPTERDEQTDGDLAPVRPDSHPTSPHPLPVDFAPRPLPLRQGEGEVKEGEAA